MQPTSPSIACVTGAASGIGRALVQQLAGAGWTVLASDVDGAGLEETQRLSDPPDRVHLAGLDVRDEDAVAAYAQSVIVEHGIPDLLINNAGIALSGRVWEMTSGDIRQIMDVNYWGVVHCTQAFLPSMMERNRGHIVNISSIFGIVGFPAMAAYNSSKFAVRGFTECLRMELDLAGSGLRVTCVHPGGVATNIVAQQRVASRRAETPDHELVQAEFDRRARTSPDAAARKILRAALRGKRRVLVGLDARLIDTAQRMFASWVQPLIVRATRRTSDLL